MTSVGGDWARLGVLVRQRRAHLGYTTRQQFTEATKFPAKTLSDLETHKRENFDPTTLARLERALNWAPGSVERILTGGSPTIGENLPVVVPADDMDPVAAEVVHMLSPASLLDDEDREDLRHILDQLLNRYRRIFRSEQVRREQERDQGED